MKKLYDKKFLVFITLLLIGGLSLVQANERIDEMLEDALSKIRPTLERIPKEIKKVSIFTIEPDKQGKVNISNLKDQIITVLLDTERFYVIDRKSLKILLEEQKLSMTGVVDAQQMLKAGKIIGVQGFFFGSVELSKEKFILNLKLIDVESSAIIFSKKFTGESAGFSRLGIGGGYLTGKYGTSIQHLVADTEVESKDMPDNSTSGFFLSLSYKQGLKAIKFGHIGFDLSFSRFPVTKYTSNTSEIINLKDLGLSYNRGYQGGFIYDLHVNQFSIYPKFYLSSKKLFGTKNDTFNPYVGVGINFISFNETISGWQNIYPNYNEATKKWAAEWEEVHTEEKTRTEGILVVAPSAGIEMNLSRSMSLFFEGVFQQKKELPDQPDMYIAKMNFNTYPYMSGGIQLNAGFKYYFNLF